MKRVAWLFITILALSPVSAYAGPMPSDVEAKVKQKLSRQHPDSYALQKLLLDSEMAAYEQIQGYSYPRVPSNVVESVKNKLSRQHPDSYALQKLLLDSEMESYVKLNRN